MVMEMTTINFKAKLSRPAGADKEAAWTFLSLPTEASQKLPSRSMVSVDGTFNGFPFQATLQPDGEGGHWLKVKPELSKDAGAKPGDLVELEIAPVKEEPEPEVPEDFLAALDAAPPKAKETWLATTPLARRDWIAWMGGGKKAETRLKRIEVACSKLANGSKRPCCFDRSGMVSKEFSCPIADMDDEA